MENIGTATIQRINDPSGDPSAWTNRILQADPRIRVARELIDDIRDGVPYAARCLHLNDSVLTVTDDYGACFIYRIHWDDYADGGYLAEWPD